jgi:hypothetical protein
VILAPFVLDVFTLDVMTEMLATPLLLLSYLNRRAGYQEKVWASHELTILSYHLKYNLWFEKQYDIVQLHDDISADLDIAMMVRREGAPGPRTPDGILTRIGDTRIGKIVREIEARPHPATISLGFTLLALAEKTVVNISNAIDAMAQKSATDGRHHDMTMPMGESGEGITVHCNTIPVPGAGPKLEGHCLLRKYRAKALRWFGICIAPDASLRFGVSLNFAWEPDPKMEQVISAFPGHGSFVDMSAIDGRRRKIGRNDPCPCGSGRKFKKCCML